MPEIQIAVRNKIAQQENSTVYVCGSGDYQIRFDFDAEWDALDLKTARFQTENLETDVLFRGNVCPVPVIGYARRMEVGVFAGNVHTTTAARIALREGIRSRWGAPEDPAPSLYDQLMEAIEDTGLKLEELPDGVLLTVRFRGGEEHAFLRHSEVYVGAGEMPEGYRVQLDVSKTPPVLRVKGLDGAMIPIPAIQGEKGEKGDPGPQGPKGDLGEHVVRSIQGIYPEEDGALTLTPKQLGAVARTGDTMEGGLNMGGFSITNLVQPRESADAATKGYVDSRRIVLRTTVPTSWTGNGPYVQTLSLPTLLGTDVPHVAAVYDSDPIRAIAQRDAWTCISQVEAMNGALKLTCLEELPQVGIPIQLEVHR